MQNGCYSHNHKKCPFCFANFSKKTWSTEKIEYTTTKPTENPSKLSSQFFHFWNFVTEIFRQKLMLKIVILSKSWYNFLFFLEHPLVYLIESNKSTARDWTNKKRPMHFGASLSSEEVLEWKCFYDKSIIGMYLLVLSSYINIEQFTINHHVNFGSGMRLKVQKWLIKDLLKKKIINIWTLPYGWKAPGATSLLWICHKNVFTLGPLLNSRKLQMHGSFFEVIVLKDFPLPTSWYTSFFL